METVRLQCPDSSCRSTTTNVGKHLEHLILCSEPSKSILNLLVSHIEHGAPICPVCKDRMSTPFGLGKHISSKHNPIGILNEFASEIMSGKFHPVSGESWEWSEEAKERRSQNNPMHREEVRKKVSETNSGRTLDKDWRQNISEGLEGRDTGPVSDEVKKKISESVESRIQEDDEYRKKLMENLEKAHQNVPSGEDHWNYGGSRPYREEDIYVEEADIRVRSTWEAKVVRVFESEGINYEYEPRSFEWTQGRTYTPDFILPERKEVIEVKGHASTECMRKGYAMWKRLPEDWSYVVIGDPNEDMPCDERRKYDE